MTSDDFSMDDMISCARREVAMRIKIYPELIWVKCMTQNKADKETMCMQSIVEHLQSVKEAGFNHLR